MDQESSNQCYNSYKRMTKKDIDGEPSKIHRWRRGYVYIYIYVIIAFILLFYLGII